MSDVVYKVLCILLEIQKRKIVLFQHPDFPTEETLLINDIVLETGSQGRSSRADTRTHASDTLTLARTRRQGVFGASPI